MQPWRRYRSNTSLRPTTIPLQTREIPPRLDDATVAAARAQIETMLQGPLTLRVGKNEYEWTVADLADMIIINRVPSAEGDRIAVTLDQDMIARRIRQIADETEKPGTRPRVAWNNGDLKIVKPGKPGLRLDEARARDMVIAAVMGRDRTLDLPMVPTDPPVTEANLHQLGIRELVSIGQKRLYRFSSLSRAQYRRRDATAERLVDRTRRGESRR